MQPVCCNSYSDRNRFWSIRVSLWQFLSDAMQCGLHALCTMCVCTVSLLLHLLCCPCVLCFVFIAKSVLWCGAATGHRLFCMCTVSLRIHLLCCSLAFHVVLIAESVLLCGAAIGHRLLCW